jgi:ABC-type multidrug transport system ATPase subunit
MCNIFGKDPTWTELKEALRKVSLEKRGNQQTRGLSTGQKRRLTLGLLHILSPSIALLDEPSNGLDSLGQSLCHSLILDLVQKGNSLVVATHDQKIIDLCSSVIDVSAFVPKQPRKQS